MSEIQSINSVDNLVTEVETNDVVLVDFYADWCGPCKMMEPVIENINDELDVTVLKIDVDNNQDIAGEFGVQGIPTLVVYDDEEPVEKLVGAKTEAQLKDKLNKYIDD